MMGVVCCMATSCGSDDEDGGNGGSDAKAAVVDGATTNFAYGFYDLEEPGYLNMEFSNVNLANPSSLKGVKKVDVVTLTMPYGEKDLKDGTYQAHMEYWSMEPATEKYLASGVGQVSVTLKKNGSKYSVTIPKTQITFYPDADEKQAKKASFTFNYNGELTYYSDF